MSGSDLPPVSVGSSTKSVFSVFGYGSSDRYGDKDVLESPLETAPVSFDASDSQDVTKRSNRRRSVEEKALPVSPEFGNLNVEKMSSSKNIEPTHRIVPRSVWALFAGFTGARKMRVTLPDNSKLALQSFGQSSSKQNGSSQTQALQQKAILSSDKNRSYSRRYSSQQGDSADEKRNSSDILEKFNSSMSLTPMFLNTQAEKGNLYHKNVQISKDDSHASSTMTTTQTWAHPDTNTSSNSGIGKHTRRQSTPDLMQLAHVEKSQGKVVESSVDPKLRVGSISQYLGRNYSHHELSSLAKQNMDVSSSDSEGKAVAVRSNTGPLVASKKMPTAVDIPDTTVAAEASQPSRFGILTQTRRFGAWLTKATDGEKVEVTKKDLNVLAPNSF